MAKTRIKTTPTRMQKEALTASAAVVHPSNTRIVTEHVLKKRLCALNNSMLAKEAAALQSTIIVQPPKRTKSISSATSTISHTSDGHSSIESPPPTSSCSNTPTNSNGPTMDELTENAIKTLNAGLLAKTNALALKNRKVYMITEKCDDSQRGTNGSGVGGANGGGGGSGGSGGTTGGGPQKRKMYLIMEEKETDDRAEGQSEKFKKSECSNGNKKLTLFTDTTNGQLPQKIEKFLPEILNCIQAKGAAAGGGGNGVTSTCSNGGKTRFVSQELNGKCTTTTNDNENSKIRLKPDTSDNNERLPLTLPPKKNRTKIITTQIIPVNNHYHHQPTPPTTTKNCNGEVTAESKGVTTTVFSTTNGSSQYYARIDKSSATPVIVNATTLMAASNGPTNGCSKENGNKLTSTTAPAQLHKNINLSTDFLFLMKMLPKLESIGEPHKNYVKACIEDIINQYAPQPFADQ